MAKTAASRPVRNHLLAALPDREYKRLLPHLKPVALVNKEVLHEPYQPIRYVYFPENGVIARAVCAQDGSSVEVGMTGKEGLTGICLFLGSSTAPFKAVVQIPGAAMRMEAAAFKAEVNRNWPWADLLLRYSQAVLCMVSQSAACNLLHNVEQRCCRWLLMAHDRMESDEFPLTQECLALMLGVHRQSITVVARSLSRRGLIRYRWGQLTVLNRQGLEAAACECYQFIQQHSRTQLL